MKTVCVVTVSSVFSNVSRLKLLPLQKVSRFDLCSFPHCSLQFSSSLDLPSSLESFPSSSKFEKY